MMIRRHQMVQLLFAAVWLLFLAADQVGALGPPKGHHKGLKDMPKHPDAFGVAEYWQWVAAVGAAHDRKLRQKQERVVIPFVHHTRLLEPQYPNFPTALAALAATNGTSKSQRSRKTIIVSKDKTAGNFTTVQAAINSVPENNKERIVIWVRTGTYREKVKIPSNKPFIHLYGDGLHMTSIEWNDTASTLDKNAKNKSQTLGTFNSATFVCDADNFIATGLSFVNTAPAPQGGEVGKQAVALRITGDKAAFYYVGFYGAQDTLYDHRGRHYFQNCFIQGSIDFIFGNGQSIYQSCRLKSIASPFGSLTAQKRDFKNETTGFSFISCSVTGTGTIYIGRAWGVYSRVVFSHTFIDDIIRPEGWYNWGVPEREKTAYFGTYKCFGPGSNTSTWPAWTRQLSKKQAKPFLNIATFIDADEWLPTPIPPTLT